MVNCVCATLPVSEVSDPWGGGPYAWQVDGTIFICINAVLPGVTVMNTEKPRYRLPRSYRIARPKLPTKIQETVPAPGT